MKQLLGTLACLLSLPLGISTCFFLYTDPKTLADVLSVTIGCIVISAFVLLLEVDLCLKRLS